MTLDDFDRVVDSIIVGRGEDYWRQGRVKLTAHSNNIFFFKVKGSGSRTYDISINLDGNRVAAHHCNCPYEGPVCKHVVACLYYLTNNPELLGEEPEEEEEEVIEEPAIIINSMDGMPARLQAYLCFLAYTGVDGNYKITRLPAIDEIAKLTSTTQYKYNDTLLANHWLEKREQNNWSNRRKRRTLIVSPKRHVEVLMYAFKKCPKWITKFKSVQLDDVEIKALVTIAKFMLDGKTTLTAKDVYPYDYDRCTKAFLEAVDYAIAMPGGEKLVHAIPVRLLSDVIDEHTINLQVNNDIHSLERSRQLLELTECNTYGMDYQHAIMRCYWFYDKAEVLPIRTEDEEKPATYYLDAAIKLYSGDTDQAIRLYKKGIAAHNKVFDTKGVPNDDIALLLYVIALARRRKPEDLKTLSTLYDKIRNNDPESSTEAVNMFTLFFKDSNQRVSSNLSRLLKSTNPQAVCIASLFSMFDNRDKPLHIPEGMECALLQAEMAALNPAIDKGIWPYPPLVTSLRHQEKWELKIDEIISTLGGTTSVNATAESNERVFYLASSKSDRVEVKTQTRLKSGAWGKGKMLSFARWHSGDFPMDDIDRTIHTKWKRHSHSYAPLLKDILPPCKGTDKVFVETKTGFYNVDIREEKPYLYTERADGKLTIHSNIPDEAMNDNFQWSPDHRSITYWPLSDSDRALYKSLLNLGTVPDAAVPKLEQLFTLLQGKIEVQSDVRGAVQLELRDGSAVIAVRITPYKEGVNVVKFAHPLENGEKYFYPGEGEQLIIDSDGTTRYKVARDLKAEKRNLKVVDDILDTPKDGKGSIQNVLDLLDNADEMRDRFYIEWPEGEVLKIVEPKSSDWNITANGKGGWFEIEGDVRVSDDEVFSIAQILDLIRDNSGRFIRLKSGEYMKLSQRLRSQLDRLDAVSQTNRGKIAIPELAMTVMGDSIEDVVELMDSKKIAARRKLIREAASMDYPTPEGLNAILRPYQEEGYRWMMSLAHWGAGACLADDMGLGKTVQSIAFLLAKASEGPQMVVAPASVIGNWHNELNRFSPSLKALVLNEHSSADRAEVLSGIGAGWIVVTTYGLLVTENDTIKDIEWQTVILDEAHTIKNRDTKMSAAAMRLKATNRIILTGTPIQNHLGELWNLFKFINPGLLGSYEHFNDKFVDRGQSKDALKRLVSPFLLRRTKNEVVKELPDKIEVTLPVQMSNDEMAVYEIIRRMAKAELETGGPLSVNALAMMTKLRMAACSASLAEKAWKGGCSKLDTFIEKLETIVESGNSVLVFSQFTSFLQMARDVMEEHGLKGYLYLDGSTPVAKRQKMVASFQKGEHHIFLISLKAGGLGLNLTGANYVIHLDPWWNPAIEQQATDRAYRIGQQQKVTVYHLISENTIEEKILRLHASKRQIADSILDGTDSPTRLTPQELLELLE